MSDRYISDKYLPDKAIDIMDEAGSRAHMINMKVPKEVTDLEKEIEKVRSEKNSVVVAQKFEDAASFRDIEQKLLNKLSKLQKNWKLDEKSNPVKITENDIADMISMVTTIPVNKVAQNEAENLLKMNFELSKKIIGQKKPLEILSKAMQRSRAGSVSYTHLRAHET